jgi:hypothetical protein
MGEDTGENVQGRIPRLERKVNAHGKKIARMERVFWMVLGAASAWKLFGGKIIAIFGK